MSAFHFGSGPPSFVAPLLCFLDQVGAKLHNVRKIIIQRGVHVSFDTIERHLISCLVL